MKTQINTGPNVECGEETARWIKTLVDDVLGHLEKHMTRVEIHLSDENSEKGGEHDKRCMMEARLEGHQPIAVTHEAQTIEQALEGAVHKLKSSLDHTLGRLHVL